MTRHFALAASLLFLASAPAHARDAVDRLADLLRSSRSAPNPIVAFLSGFRDLDDFTLDGDGLRQAVARAELPAGELLDQVLRSTTSIRKRGRTVEIRRGAKATVPLAGQGVIELGERVRFDVRVGRLQDLDEKTRRRLRRADRAPGYVHIDDPSGIRVGLSARSLYQLFDLVLVEERGQPVMHLQAGVAIFRQWKRIELPASAPAVVAEAPTGARNGMVAGLGALGE